MRLTRIGAPLSEFTPICCLNTVETAMFIYCFVFSICEKKTSQIQAVDESLRPLKKGAKGIRKTKYMHETYASCKWYSFPAIWITQNRSICNNKTMFHASDDFLTVLQRYSRSYLFSQTLRIVYIYFSNWRFKFVSYILSGIASDGEQIRTKSNSKRCTKKRKENEKINKN